MDAQFVSGFVIVVFGSAYATAETYVRTARRRDAQALARARRGVRPGARDLEATRPDEKPEERHEPRPVGAR